VTELAEVVIDEAGILSNAMQFVALVAHCFERTSVSRDSRCLITNAEKLLRLVDNVTELAEVVIDEAGILSNAMQFVALVAHCFERTSVSRDSRCLITNAEKLLRLVDNDDRVFRQLKPFMRIIEGNPGGFKPFELGIESADVVIEDSAIFLRSLDINFFDGVQGFAVALQASAKNEHGLPLNRAELSDRTGGFVHAGNNSASYDGSKHDVYSNVHF
ncbi:hypothetical protein AN168_23490, partial [Vibrio splendidus]